MKPSISIQTVRKSVASSLIAALVLTAPGLSPYEALAKGPGGGALRTSGITGASSLNIGNISPGRIPSLETLGVSGKGDLTPIPGQDLLGLQSPGTTLGIGGTQDIRLLNDGPVGSAQGAVSASARAVHSADGVSLNYGQEIGQIDPAGISVNARGETASGGSSTKGSNEAGPMTKAAAKTVGHVGERMPAVIGSNPGANPDAVQQELDATYYKAQGKTGANATPVAGEAGVARVGMPGNNLLADAGSAAANKQEAAIPGVEANKTSALVVQPQAQPQPSQGVFGLDNLVTGGLALAIVFFQMAWVFRQASKNIGKPLNTSRQTLSQVASIFLVPFLAAIGGIAFHLTLPMMGLSSAGKFLVLSASLSVLMVSLMSILHTGLSRNRPGNGPANPTARGGSARGSITGMGLLVLGALLGFGSAALAGTGQGPVFGVDHDSMRILGIGLMLLLGVPSLIFTGIGFAYMATGMVTAGARMGARMRDRLSQNTEERTAILAGIFLTYAAGLLVSLGFMFPAAYLNGLAIVGILVLGVPSVIIAAVGLYYAGQELIKLSRKLTWRHASLATGLGGLVALRFFLLPHLGGPAAYGIFLVSGIAVLLGVGFGQDSGPRNGGGSAGSGLLALALALPSLAFGPAEVQPEAVGDMDGMGTIRTVALATVTMLGALASLLMMLALSFHTPRDMRLAYQGVRQEGGYLFSPKIMFGLALLAGLWAALPFILGSIGLPLDVVLWGMIVAPILIASPLVFWRIIGGPKNYEDYDIQVMRTGKIFFTAIVLSGIAAVIYGLMQLPAAVLGIGVVVVLITGAIGGHIYMVSRMSPEERKRLGEMMEAYSYTR